MADPYEVVLGSKAAAELLALGPRRRAQLGHALVQLARAAPRQGLGAAWTWFDLAACELLAESRVVLVYAVVAWPDLRRALRGRRVTG